MKKLKILLLFIVFSTVCITTCFAQTELNISIDSLPLQIKEHLHHKFDKYSIASIMQKTDEKGIITYLLSTRREKNSSETIVYYLIYESGGKLISKKKGKEFYYTGEEKKSKAGTPGGSQRGHQH